MNRYLASAPEEFKDFIQQKAEGNKQLVELFAGNLDVSLAVLVLVRNLLISRTRPKRNSSIPARNSGNLPVSLFEELSLKRSKRPQDLLLEVNNHPKLTVRIFYLLGYKI